MPTPAPTVTEVRVTGPSALALPGEGFPMSAVAVLSNGTTPVVTATASWSSSNTAVATTASTGIVTFHSGGTARITATYEGRSGWADVNVIAIDPSDKIEIVSLTPASGTELVRGAEVEFTARLQYTLAEDTGRLAALAQVNNSPNVFVPIAPAVDLTLTRGSGTIEIVGRFTVSVNAGAVGALLFQLFPGGAPRTNVLAIAAYTIR